MKIFFSAEHDNQLAALHQLGDVVMAGWALGQPPLTEAQLIEGASDCDMIITSYDPISAAVIDHCPQLKLIGCTRANPINIDWQAANQRNIPLIYAPGRNANAVAELTIAHLLSVARHLPQAHLALKQQQFTAATVVDDQASDDVIWGVSQHSPYAVFKGIELRGKTLGIIGYGAIGRRVAHLARAFGMALLIYDPYLTDISINEPAVSLVALADLLSQADFVTLHVNVTPATRGLINAQRLALMKNSAYLINTSRAAVIDEPALITALQQQQIAGAGLDVYAQEPIRADHPYIHQLTNVTLTPHIAGATYEVLTNHMQMIISDIQRFLAGEALLYRYSG